MRFVIAFLLSVGLGPGCVASGPLKATAPSEWDGSKGKCSTGLYPQPGGPFAVLLFCEDALGDYLSVVHLQPMGMPSVAAWSLENRYWFAPVWGDDITGFRWSRDGSTLFVSTSGIYGSGGAFALALRERKATQLLPAKTVSSVDPGPGFKLRDLPQK